MTGGGSGASRSAVALVLVLMLPLVGHAQPSPQIDIQMDPKGPAGDEGWYRQPAHFTIHAEGQAPLEVEYRLDGGPWRPYGNAVQVPEGQTKVEARVTDKNGQEALAVQVVRADTESPVATLLDTEGTLLSGWSHGPITAVPAVEDAASGVREVLYRIDSGPWTSWDGGAIGTFGEGVHGVWIQAVDRAGNQLGPQRSEVRVDPTPPIVSPVQWSYDPSTWLVEARWSDDHYDATSGVAGVRVEVDEGNGWTEAHSVAPTGEDSTRLLLPVAPGVHTLRLVVTDAAGNEASTAVRQVEAVQAIPSGAAREVRGDVPLVQEEDLGGPVQRIDVFIDGAFAASARNEALVWDSRLAADGEHTITRVTVFDDGTASAVPERFEVRNGYFLVLADHAFAVAAVATALLAVAVYAALRLRAGADPGVHRWGLGFGGLFVFGAALAVLLVRSTTAILTYEILLATVALFAGVLYVRQTFIVPEPEPEAPRKRDSSRPVDFDRAWKGRRSS